MSHYPAFPKKLFQTYYSKAEYGPSISPSVLLSVTTQPEEIFKETVTHMAPTPINNSLLPHSAKPIGLCLQDSNKGGAEKRVMPQNFISSINAQLT